MATMSQSQPNGIPSTAGPSQPSQGSSTVPNTQQTTATATTTSSAAAAATAQSPGPAQGSNSGGGTTTTAPRPRDARTIELLLTSQGVTSFDSRVPLLLLDFAYRHTSGVLNDALHLTTDPYVSHAGARPSGASGAAPSAPSGSDAAVSSAAVGIAIAARQAYAFRGGNGAYAGHAGAGGGAASRDWLADLARERNRVALPRVLQHEWGVRLPAERFVLSGAGWSLRDRWAGAEAGLEDGDDDDEGDDGDDNGDDDENAMEGLETMSGGGAGIKGTGGTEEGNGRGLDELLGDDLGDEDMEGME
ncbi:hypothetical protein DL764_004549 [Monosporascus ibericus]|uniref:Transcription initiation factor TFIID subunit 9 n=1 Tax=Monosporascus ibericus TaxID=155417 RepID=A0A4Q4TC68_9PEZI|nr:hypothetical protein DL764_004549 [Monosporascus ibericus]